MEELKYYDLEVLEEFVKKVKELSNDPLACIDYTEKDLGAFDKCKISPFISLGPTTLDLFKIHRFYKQSFQKRDITDGDPLFDLLIYYCGLTLLENFNEFSLLVIPEFIISETPLENTPLNHRNRLGYISIILKTGLDNGGSLYEKEIGFKSCYFDLDNFRKFITEFSEFFNKKEDLDSILTVLDLFDSVQEEYALKNTHTKTINID